MKKLIDKILSSNKVEKIIEKLYNKYTKIIKKLLTRYNLKNDLKQGKIYTIIVLIIILLLVICHKGQEKHNIKIVFYS